MKLKKDSTIEITKRVKEKLLEKRGLFSRLVHAFPSLKRSIEEKHQAMEVRRNEFILKTKKSIENSKEKLEKDLKLRNKIYISGYHSVTCFCIYF